MDVWNNDRLGHAGCLRRQRLRRSPRRAPPFVAEITTSAPEIAPLACLSPGTVTVNRVDEIMNRSSRPIVVVAGCCFWLLTTACSADHGTRPEPSDDSPVVSSVRVFPSEKTLGVLGTTVRLAAGAYTADGTNLYGFGSSPGRFTWASSDPTVAPVNEDGVVTAVSEGTATISVTVEGTTGSISVTVQDRAHLAWSVPTTPRSTVADASVAIGANGIIYVGMNEAASYSTFWYALSPNGSVLWTLTLPQTGFSSPAIAEDGTLYLGSWSDSGFAGSLIAVDPSGTIRWVLEGLDAIWSSPALGADGTVLVAGGRHVYAVSPQGQIRWTYAAEGAEVFYYSSPAVASDGTIYVGGYDNQLHAINGDGSPKWRFQTGDIIRSSPSIGMDGTIYFGSDDGRLYAVHPDGTERWNVDVDYPQVSSSPSIGSDGTIYMGGGAVFAIDPSGSIRWRFPVAGVMTTPVLGADGRVYFVQGGGIAALDSQGHLLWDYSAPSSASPAIGIDGRIIVTSYSALGSSVLAITEKGPSNGGYEGSPWPTSRGDRANSGRAGG